MNDMSQVIIPKSDQINADTLLAGPMTVTIKDVHISGGQEQPVSIALQDTPLFFRPCKSMSRCLVNAWGADAKNYIGRSLTLYRDPSVKWGGMEVGGIRISHMSHLDGKLVMQLTATKGQRKPHVVMPLIAEVKQLPTSAPRQSPDEWATAHAAATLHCADLAALDALIVKGAKAMAKLAGDHPDLHQRVRDAYNIRRSEIGAFDGVQAADDAIVAEDTAE